MKDENTSLLTRFSGLFSRRTVAGATVTDPTKAIYSNSNSKDGKTPKSYNSGRVPSNMVLVVDSKDSDKYKPPSSPAKARLRQSAAVMAEPSSNTSSRLLSMLRLGSLESTSVSSQVSAKSETSRTSVPVTAKSEKPAAQPPAATAVTKDKKAAVDDTGTIRQLGLYDVGATIGSGTFSKVRMGYNRVTGEKVAVKIITKNESQKGFNTKRIFQEVNVQKAATHSRICQILNVFDTGSHVCIILEYAPTDLLQYINSTRLKYLSEAESRHLFTQMMDAVAYLHARGIIHRDLKPQNVLLDTDMNVKIADFGFGKMQEHDLLSTVCGSSVYAAPELVRYKRAYAGKPADIWACGVILYNMLLGKMPFKKLSQQMKTTARHILYDPLIPEHELMLGLEIPAAISAEAADLIRRLVSIDVSKRLSADDVLQHRWMDGPVMPGGNVCKLKSSLADCGSFPV